MKRLFDMVFSLIGLMIISPVLIIFIFLIWRQDFKSPFYIALRVGRYGKSFKMVKLRSMVADADKSGINSTAAGDMRITRVGHLIRRYKLDEFSQLWNVLIGQMSLVGPRPQVKQDVDLYTKEERHLLDARPGITDLSSIVFSDEGDILIRHRDWKRRLCNTRRSIHRLRRPACHCKARAGRLHGLMAAKRVHELHEFTRNIEFKIENY